MALLSHRGHGIGLRPPHYPRVVDGTARVDWFEVISENFMIPGGRPLGVLEKARELAPVVLHGVSMNLGGTDPLGESHLCELERLISRFDPAWVSEHLCWGAFGHQYAHDLLPLPYPRNASARFTLRATATRVRTWWTRTITPCRRPSGRSTATPCDASVRYRPSSSGTTTSPRSKSWSPRRIVPARSRRRRSVPVAGLRELQQLFWRSLADEPGTVAPELIEAVLPRSTLDSSAR